MKRTPFTIVELLVVISVIAILAALLLPALNKAMERGHATLCTGNLKQIGLAELSYANDFDDWTVRGRPLTLNGTSTGAESFIHTIADLKYAGNVNIRNKNTIFVCPNDKRPEYNSGDTFTPRMSYGTNTCVTQGLWAKVADDARGTYARDRHRRFGELGKTLKGPSRTVLVTDCFGYESGGVKKYFILRSGGSPSTDFNAWFSDTPPASISLRHGGNQAVTLFCDGRAKAVKGPMMNDVTSGTYVQWLNPDTADGMNR